MREIPVDTSSPSLIKASVDETKMNEHTGNTIHEPLDLSPFVTILSCGRDISRRLLLDILSGTSAATANVFQQPLLRISCQLPQHHLMEPGRFPPHYLMGLVWPWSSLAMSTKRISEQSNLRLFSHTVDISC